MRASVCASKHPRAAPPRTERGGQARVPTPRARGPPHRLPHPPAPAANGSSSPALRSPGRRRLGRIKQAERRTLVIAEGRGLPRYPEAERNALGQASAAPRRGSKPRKVWLQGRNLQQPLPAGAPPAGNGGPLGTASPGSLFPGTSAPAPPSQPGSSRSLQARAGAAPGPLALQKPQLVHRCSFRGVTWGRGGYTTETGTFLSLSPPAPPALSLRLRLLCGARRWGPVPGRSLLHLRRQCLLAPCAAQSRSLGRRRRPMQQRRAGTGREGAEELRSLSARSPGQSPRQEPPRGGSRQPRATN